MKPLVMNLFPITRFFFPLMSKYFLQRPGHGNTQPNEKDQLSHPYKTIDEIPRLYISVFLLLNCKLEGKISESKVGKNFPTSATTTEVLKPVL
jgi:hypothetical protein